MLAKFTVQFFVNGENTSTVENLDFDQAYNMAVPGEALTMDGWHVLMKHAARTEIAKLFAGETLRISYQDPVRPGFDCEHILMMLAPIPSRGIEWSKIQPTTHKLSQFFEALRKE